jgi:hypothetical protein
MRRYAWPLVCAIGLVLCAPLILAQPSDLSSTYLPMVFRPVPTPTPTNTATATSTPLPTSMPTATNMPIPPTPTRDPGVCAPEYPTVCIPPPPPDLDCPDIPYRNFLVLPPDHHHFDTDHDGIGCET